MYFTLDFAYRRFVCIDGHMVYLRAIDPKRVGQGHGCDRHDEQKHITIRSSRTRPWDSDHDSFCTAPKQKERVVGDSQHGYLAACRRDHPD